jgi:trigger factor
MSTVVKLSKKKNLFRKYECTIPKNYMHEMVEKKIAEITPKVKIDGFRAGSVPADVIKGRYLESIIADIKDSEIRNAFEVARKENDNKIAKIYDLVFEKNSNEVEEVSFSFSVDLMPEISVDFSKIKFEKPTLQVSEQDIEMQIKNISERFCSKEEKPSDEKTEDGDVVTIDFVGRVDGNVFEGGTAKGYDLKLGSKSFIDNFESQLIDKSLDEQVLVKVKFPEQYHAQNLAGKESEFDVTIRAINKSVPHEINDELAKKANMGNSVSDMREKISNDLQTYHDNTIKQKLKSDLLEKLKSDFINFDLPEKVFEIEYGSILERMKSENEKLDQKTRKKEKEIIKDAEKMTKERLGISYLVFDVAKKNNIEATQSDVYQFVIRESIMSGIDIKRMEEELLNDKEKVSIIESIILEDKVLDHILSLCTLNAKPTNKEGIQKYLSGK